MVILGPPQSGKSTLFHKVRHFRLGRSDRVTLVDKARRWSSDSVDQTGQDVDQGDAHSW